MPLRSRPEVEQKGIDKTQGQIGGQVHTRGVSKLGEVALLYLRLGVTAFGGPAAHIAMMEDEVVRRRQWLSREKFLDLLAAANLIPGPSSTEMAIYLGFLRAGWAGLIVAGVCFIVPAMILVTMIAWAYVRYGNLPQFIGPLYAVKPVLIAIILQALLGLGRQAIKNKFLAAVAGAAAFFNFFGIAPVPLLLAAGAATGVERGFAQNWRDHLRAMLVMVAIAGGIVVFASLAAHLQSTAQEKFGLMPLFAFFLKIGSILYGSGYVILAFLKADLVDHWHWLTAAQILDATAVGQVTPGPVFTTATFIGYILGGLKGALIATVGIFLPSFVFVAISGPLIPKVRRSVIAGAFLNGVIAASLALMAVVTWHLGRAAIIDVPTALIALTSAVLLMRFRVNSAWLVLGAALVGFFRFSA